MHKSYVVGDLSIAVILKLREGMHFSRSKNARLLNYYSVKLALVERLRLPIGKPTSIFQTKQCLGLKAKKRVS